MLVAEQLLDLAQVRAGGEQLGCEHVAQRVRGDPLACGDPDPFGQAAAGEIAYRDDVLAYRVATERPRSGRGFSMGRFAGGIVTVVTWPSGFGGSPTLATKRSAERSRSRSARRRQHPHRLGPPRVPARQSS
jgi:hypothetical protein